MVQYGIVSFSSYVWHLFLGEKLYLTGPKSRWCIFFWVFLGQKLPSKFCPKMTCFRSCCSMGILQPRIFFHANKYRKKKILLRTWHPQKFARFRRWDTHHLRVSISNSCFRIAPYLHKIHQFWNHMKVRSTHRKREASVAWIVSSSRVFCVFKNLGNDHFV